MSKVYYNEFDPAAAAWLRELMANNLIAQGDVDERSIKDVRGDELRGYAQCHFFAGIGIWSAALRRNGWNDDRPVWTGSCPCQPFSAAGKGLGFEDPRHLWPDWLRLIAECRPDTVLGEQVASAGLWLDLVRTDMEDHGYAFGCVDLPAAGFAQGAHIRQRLYWVADSDTTERWADLAGGHFGDWPQAGRIEGYGELGTGGAICGLADSAGGQPGHRLVQHGGEHRQQSQDSGTGFGMGDGLGLGLGLEGSASRGREVVSFGREIQERQVGLPGGACDWLYCRDGKLRPVETGTFPLAAAHPGRLGLLRGYGNSLDFEAASNFIGAYMEAAEIADTMHEFA
jgi:DNA (cytosine-5)-methyltransferase 1